MIDYEQLGKNIGSGHGGLPTPGVWFFRVEQPESSTQPSPKPNSQPRRSLLGFIHRKPKAA